MAVERELTVVLTLPALLTDPCPHSECKASVPHLLFLWFWFLWVVWFFFLLYSWSYFLLQMFKMYENKHCRSLSPNKFSFCK